MGLEPLILLASRITDPVLEPIERRAFIRSSLGSTRVRSMAIAVIGAVLLVVFAVRLSGPFFDEMPLAALALWVLVVVGGVYVAGLRAGHRGLPLE